MTSRQSQLRGRVAQSDTFDSCFCKWRTLEVQNGSFGLQPHRTARSHLSHPLLLSDAAEMGGTKEPCIPNRWPR